MIKNLLINIYEIIFKKQVYTKREESLILFIIPILERLKEERERRISV